MYTHTHTQLYIGLYTHIYRWFAVWIQLWETVQQSAAGRTTKVQVCSTPRTTLLVWRWSPWSGSCLPQDQLVCVCVCVCVRKLDECAVMCRCVDIQVHKNCRTLFDVVEDRLRRPETGIQAHAHAHAPAIGVRSQQTIRKLCNWFLCYSYSLKIF